MRPFDFVFWTVPATSIARNWKHPFFRKCAAVKKGKCQQDLWDGKARHVLVPGGTSDNRPTSLTLGTSVQYNTRPEGTAESTRLFGHPWLPAPAQRHSFPSRTSGHLASKLQSRQAIGRGASHADYVHPQAGQSRASRWMASGQLAKGCQ